MGTHHIEICRFNRQRLKVQTEEIFHRGQLLHVMIQVTLNSRKLDQNNEYIYIYI